MNLYQITEDQLNIISLLEDNGGEATPEVLEAIAITREAFNKKAEGYSCVILKMDGEADIIAAEIKRLQALKKTKENSVLRLKEALTSAMLIFGQEDNKGIKRFETSTLKLSTRKSESVNITDEASVPEQYWVVKKEISKSAITNSIKAGEIVEGAEMKTNYSVTIR